MSQAMPMARDVAEMRETEHECKKSLRWTFQLICPQATTSLFVALAEGIARRYLLRRKK